MARKTRKKRIGKGKRKRSKKVRLLDTTRTLKALAVNARLSGRIQDATHYESLLDRTVHELERMDAADQAMRAEEAGHRIGQRYYERNKE
jgi:hypothetical protein